MTHNWISCKITLIGSVKTYLVSSLLSGWVVPPLRALKKIEIKIHIAQATNLYANNPYTNFDENPFNSFGF